MYHTDFSSVGVPQTLQQVLACSLRLHEAFALRRPRNQHWWQVQIMDQDVSSRPLWRRIAELTIWKLGSSLMCKNPQVLMNSLYTMLQ